MKGRVVTTRKEGSTDREFSFLIYEGEVNPFDYVVVSTKKRKYYGMVMAIEEITDRESFFDAVIDIEQAKEEEPGIVRRVYAKLAKAEIIATSDGARMPPPDMAEVTFPNEKEFEDMFSQITGVKIRDENRIPIGFIEQGGVKYPVHIDINWLIGPQAAHLNVSGKTRVAAKTSYVIYLIQAILQKQRNVAVIIFNTKRSDLLQIHKPWPKLSGSVKEDWEKLGLNPIPFDEEKIKYLLPINLNFKINSDLTNLPVKSNNIADQPDNYFIYGYVLRNLRGKLRYLLETASGIELTDPQISFVSALDRKKESYAYKCRTLDELCNKLDNIASKQEWHLGAHPKTISVVSRYIRELCSYRTTGVICFNREEIANPRLKEVSEAVRSLESGQILVIDIDPLADFERGLVFSDVLRSIREIMASGRGPGFILFIDELNRYAPKGARRKTALHMELIDITSRGGASRLILFGAEQFASQIDEAVYGNIANKAFGRTEPTEAAESPYRNLPDEMKKRLSELRPGELIVSYDFFGRPLKIRFPHRVVRMLEDSLG